MSRRAALKAASPLAAAAMAENFLAAIPLKPGAVVSAFIAIGDETDPGPLLDRLRARGHTIVLPRVVGKNKPLDFHIHAAGAALVPGGFGLSEPSRDWPKADPDVLVVPLLAFDPAGYRLGYGAGFYDRTLARLRAERTVLAAGFAFSGQEVPHVPHHDGDERLDWVVTEIGARPFHHTPGMSR